MSRGDVAGDFISFIYHFICSSPYPERGMSSGDVAGASISQSPPL
jgi:hypothetical protein